MSSYKDQIDEIFEWHDNPTSCPLDTWHVIIHSLSEELQNKIRNEPINSKEYHNALDGFVYLILKTYELLFESGGKHVI